MLSRLSTILLGIRHAPLDVSDYTTPRLNA